MSDYSVFFAEQMAEWSKTRMGPPPVYNSDMDLLKIPNHRFDLEKAIADMSRKDRTLLMWIYEHWALQQNQKEYFPVEKAKIL